MSYQHLSTSAKKEIELALENLNNVLREHYLFLETLNLEISSVKHGYIGLLEDSGHSLSLFTDENDYIEIYTTESKE